MLECVSAPVWSLCSSFTISKPRTPEYECVASRNGMICPSICSLASMDCPLPNMNEIPTLREYMAILRIYDSYLQVPKQFLVNLEVYTIDAH